MNKTDAEISQQFRHMYGEALNHGFMALGKHLSNIVSDYLSRKYEISPSETYSNPEILHEALAKSLGYGAIIVEMRMLKFLHTQLSLPMGSPPNIRLGHPEDFAKSIFEIRTSAKNIS